MRTKLADFLKIQDLTKSDIARLIGQSPQLVGVWEKHESKECIIDWDVDTGEIRKVTLEKIETVYKAEETAA